MTVRFKLLFVIYLVLWTTFVAWLMAILVKAMYAPMTTGLPFLYAIVTGFPVFTPIFAFPVALYESTRVFRKGGDLPCTLTRYFLETPLKIYFVLLVIVSLMTVIFAPVAFVVGILLGIIPLLIGTPIHCLGILPLWFFEIESASGTRPLGYTSNSKVNSFLQSVLVRAAP